MAEMLFEILAEEIPAPVLPQARAELLQNVARELADRKINGTFFVHSTSRRLILVGHGLIERQDDYEVEAIGPSVSAAYGADGSPTRAAEGFARGQGVPVESLRRTTTPKGEYVLARKTVEGRDTSELLAEILPAVISKMSFPRMMRWGDGTHAWVRPVHSVIALFDGLVVPFDLYGVETGRSTRGHRTLSSGNIVVTGVDDYFAKLRSAFVEPDMAVRQRHLAEDAERLASEVGGVPSQDADLVESWSHLVEWPGLSRGTFAPDYLELPEEILVTTLRHHQKTLPIRNAEGKLLGSFLAVCDQASDPKGFIRQGNEWVVNARFADARFFYDDDGKTRLEDRLGKLGALTFQEKLGDYLRKTGRIQELAERLSARLGKSELAGSVVKAARLLKTDLVTGMVGEFPELQGIVGGLYARREGEAEPICQALYDHYKPASFEDSIPRGDVGGIVALADRLDTLTGLFGLGLVPTGSKDPYALRRAALGVVKILVEKKWRLDLPVACSDALALHGRDLPRKRDEVLPELSAFLMERLRNLLERRGFKADEIEAVLSTEVRDVADAVERVTAVAAIRKRPDFGPLAIAFKRIVNILAQAPDVAGEPDLSRMTEDAEKQLAMDYLQARSILDELIGKRRYDESLLVMASLGPSLDLFFSEVMVLTEDLGVRANRIALLRSMRDQFYRVARLSEIQG